MSTPPNDDGPAFPIFTEDGAETGMTMRQWLAGQALAGMCANKELAGTDAKLIARWSVECANATLAELKGPQ